MQVLLFFFNQDIALKFLGNKFNPLNASNNTKGIGAKININFPEYSV